MGNGTDFRPPPRYAQVRFPGEGQDSAARSVVAKVFGVDVGFDYQRPVLGNFWGMVELFCMLIVVVDT